MVSEFDFTAGIVEAEYLGNNVFKIKTKNVESLSIWLNEELVDFKQLVTIDLNGKISNHQLSPSREETLRSYDRRKDTRLIYQDEIHLKTD